MQDQDKKFDRSGTTMTKDQREFPRVSSRCIVDFSRVGNDQRLEQMRQSSEGLLQNISGGGVCVRMDEDPGAGQLLALTIRLPQIPTSVIALGKVAWARPTDNGTDVGIEFWWVGWEDAGAQEEIRTFLSDSLRERSSQAR